MDQTREEIRKELEDEYKTKLAAVESDYQTKLAETTARLESDNRSIIQKALEDWRKEQQPTTPDEIGQLLSQEYVTFPVQLSDRKENRMREFVISELPIAMERKFYQVIREKFLPRIKDIDTLAQLPDEEGNLAVKAQALFDMIDPAAEMLAEMVVMVLNPRGDGDITTDWVQENVSSFRMWNILLAQVEVNKLRDFFSGVSRSSQLGKMMPVGTRR